MEEFQAGCAPATRPAPRRSLVGHGRARNLLVASRIQSPTSSGTDMRSLLLWLIGVPIPIIIVLWLVTGHA
ncbi:MAG: hypothetical protein ISS15_04075 [Alphaproteobacteria bacterium]|nr:hypothetical protein [Alphaproteobacteria bacterium]MBL6939298.1 hypothetical protein [Alphaproteobacteria bacterium]MBL7096814.1 hypothetical protein [Alphaproteobacteria bacterium]